MLRHIYRWLTAPRPLEPGWHELWRYGSHPYEFRYTFAHYDGHGGWWQWQDGGSLWQRFDPKGWTLVRG